ncbi:MAG: TonB-dependent receptor domain-containing protein, partial [Gemmatimonadaceae bacterium]
VSAGYLSSRVQRVGNDDNFFGVLTGGLLGRAFDDTAKRGYFFARPDKIYTAEALQRIQRFTGSVSGNYLPIRWLTISGTAGVDYVDMEDGLLVPPGIFDPVTESPQFAVGIRQSDAFRFFNYTANGSATGTFTPTPDLESSTTVGVQYAKRSQHGTQAFGQNLTPGTSSLNGATQLFNVDEASQEIVTLGVLAQQQFSWKDRLFVTGAVRTDENSAFGTNFDRVYYPAASVSWVVGEEPFFPANDVLSSLRLRAAYGESGQNPQFRQAITFFQPVTVAFLGLDVGGVTVGGTGNADLEPEVSKEFELGFDAGFFRDRASIELTYYHKNTENVLLAQPLPPSVGTTQIRSVNIGEVQNKGFELSLNATLLETRPVTFDLTVNGATNDNEVRDLGGLPPLSFTLGVQRIQKGYPLGGYWSRRLLSFADGNNDGVIGPTEIVLSDTAEFLGASPFPKREVSIAPTLTLYRYVRVSGLLDYRGGLQQANGTEALRCILATNCRPIQDRNQPLADQAKAVAAALGNLGVYIEDADFWKLREVSVTLTPPVRWANRLGVSGLSLTLSGRNLATWTDYSGFDPEVNAIGQLDNFTTLDFVSAPPVRYYTARVEVTW